MLAAGLVELGSRSERLEVERAALAALDGLRASSGGYLAALEPYAGQFAAGDLDAVFNRLLGRAPAVLVSTGDASYETRSMGRRRAVMVLELHVDVISAHLRSRESRRAGDEAGALGQGDPGIYAILADVRDRLMGADLGISGIEPPIASSEESLVETEALAVFRATYSVRCAIEAQPPAGQPVRQLESLEHRHNLVGSPQASPVVTAETTSG